MAQINNLKQFIGNIKQYSSRNIVEEKHSIKVNDEYIASLITVKDLMNYIEGHK